MAILTACSDQCGNTIIKRSPAPDGSNVAVMFQRDCGATTGFSTQVSILKAEEKLTGSGNAFRSGDDHGTASAGEWGGPWAAVKWVGPDRLIIRYAKGSRVFEQDGEVSGVSIAYQAVDH